MAKGLVPTPSKGMAPTRRAGSVRFPLLVPWGRGLQHPVTPLDLLAMLLAFTQNSLLKPEDFVVQAKKRGLSLRAEQLLELHRRRLLVPFYQLRRQPGRSGRVVPVAAVAASGYSQSRSPIALVTEAAQAGCLRDPATERFRSWAEGLQLPVASGRRSRYPAAFYSPYQLLGLRAIGSLCREMSYARGPGGEMVCTVGRARVEDIAALDAGRRLAVLLSALDMHYLPHIKLIVHHATAWEQEDPHFTVASRLRPFGLGAEQLAAVAETLLSNAHSTDPTGAWYQLIRQAHPDTWDELGGDALLAIDYRIAAEILLKAVDDLGRRDLSTPPPVAGRMFRATLDDRLLPDRASLDEALTSRGLSPQPSLLLALEGKTEMLLMPRVLQELYGAEVPPTLVEFVHMDTVDRDLDLLVRHSLSPRFGRDMGDAVFLTRPPTRILIAVDPEKKYRTRALQREERDKLARRLFEALPDAMRTPAARAEIDTVVHVTTWGTQPWEFANFTDRELALGILDCVSPPSGITTSALVSLIAAERARTSPAKNRVANIENVTASWPRKATKIALVEALWPTLRRKIRRRPASGEYRVPAARVGVLALQLALETHRRSVVLRVR